MNIDEFKTLWDTILAFGRMVQVVSVEDVQKLLEIESMAHSIGPILYPSEYINGNSNLDEQRILATGFLAFRKAIEECKEIGRTKGSGSAGNVV